MKIYRKRMERMKGKEEIKKIIQRKVDGIETKS